ncbi:MAG: hypothetical protein ACOVNU_08585 [Candidatus Kapaibacteriota bacterium]|jgi:hypothetical protein
MYKNYYYFIEDLDVTNDDLPDGVLVRQFKIDKKRNIYHYIKNSYITDDNLVKIIDDVVIQIQNNSDNKLLNTILVSNLMMNKIRNKHIPIEEIPRVAISKSSHFAHLIKGKNIDITKLIKDLTVLLGKQKLGK